MVQQGFLRVLLLVPIFLFSLCVHEFAHAWVANRRGDPTARNAGRLSLHPLAHADMLGTFILPILCLAIGAPFLGWARPVPVDVRNLKQGRRDMALVALAGPLSNIVLSLLGTLFLTVLIQFPVEHPLYNTVQLFTVVSIQVNLMLAFFNLLPIPPLDGFNIVHGVAPRAMAIQLEKIFRFAPFLLLLLIFSGAFRWISLPVYFFYGKLLALAGVQSF